MRRINRGKYYFYIIIILLLVYLGLELFLPGIAEKKVRKGILNYTDEVKSLEIEANSFPAWELLFSRVDNINIKASYLKMKGLRLDNISASYQDIVLKEGIIKGKNKDLNILITEKSLNDYLAAQYPGLSNFDIILNPDQVFMEGYINFFNNKIMLQLNGKFTVKEANKITFIPKDVKIEDLKISKALIQKFVKDLGFSFNLSQLNFPITVEKIEITDKKLYLLGGIFVRKAGQ